jgi:hypothetical protein
MASGVIMGNITHYSLLIPIFALAACANTPSKSFLEQLRWGSAPSALGAHIEVSKPDRYAKLYGRCYSRVDEEPLVAEATSTDTQYCYNRGQLYSVMAKFDGEATHQQWMRRLTDLYGQPTVNRPPFEVSWKLPEGGYASLIYRPDDDAGSVSWLNNRYAPPSSSPSCEPWDKAFKSCLDAEAKRISEIDAR